MEMLAAAYVIANKNPLGSGAGYGSSFPLNRITYHTSCLDFESMNYNSVYAQMSRGKTEKIVAQALCFRCCNAEQTCDGLLLVSESELRIYFFSDRTDHRQQHHAA